MSRLHFTGCFSHYQPINFDPYYVFTTDKKYLVRCKDYPHLISTLSPQDLVNIDAETDEVTHFGTKLKNVKFGGDDE